MPICEPYTIGAYVILCYDYDEFGDPIVIDEYWRDSFDDALYLVSFSWEYPFEICRYEKYDKESRTFYKQVARSKQFAIL